MIPKEKAEELIMKMSIFKNKYCAKSCALIAVDEILHIYANNFIAGVNYWQEVKQELEKP